MFHRLKVAPPVKGVCWMKIVNKTSFEHGAPRGVNEYRVPSGVISAFYSRHKNKKLNKVITTNLHWAVLKSERVEESPSRDAISPFQMVIATILCYARRRFASGFSYHASTKCWPTTQKATANK